jgi:hypothetical protein
MLARKRWTWQLGIAQNVLALAGIGYLACHWETLKQKAIATAAATQRLDPQAEEFLRQALGIAWAIALGAITLICLAQIVGFWRNRNFLRAEA